MNAPLKPSRPLSLTVKFHGPDYEEPFSSIDDPEDLRDAKLEVLSGCAVQLASIAIQPDASAPLTPEQRDWITALTWRPVWQSDTIVFTVRSDADADLIEAACDLWDAGMASGSAPFVQDREHSHDVPRYRTRP